jgi:lipopolysaccharide transport system ATP-binding protein
MSSEMSVDIATDTVDRAIVVDGVGKCYQIYERPQDRLKQALVPRLARLMGLRHSNYFRDFWALRDVSLTVARGETVGIIGRNGSGKSTLLQIVCGTLTPTHGNVAISGRIGALLELGSGFNPEFTGRENVYMNGTVLGMDTTEIDAKYDAIVAFADIGDFIDQPVKTYSSGMYVRLAFAVIAHADADILVIDEALSVGDVFFGQKCMRFLRDFQKHGTVLFVSHDAGAVINLCDRVVWMDDGRVAMDGPAKTVCEAYLASTYGHRSNRIAAPSAETTASLPDDLADVEDAQRSDHAASGSDDFDPALDQSRMRVFRFDPERAGFGDGGATMLSVRLESSDSRPLVQLSGGEIVRLIVQAQANRDIPRPIVGFLLKDRLGQHLFGTNTCIGDDSSVPAIAKGRTIEAIFEFRMPYLPPGHYTIDVAIADGNALEHVQAVWVYDALVLESICETRSTGLVGIPYRAIALRALDAVEQTAVSAASDGVPA